MQRLRASFSGTLPEASGISYGVLRGAADAVQDAEDEVLDEVLVVHADEGAAARAYELHVHGSPFVVREIMARLGPASSGPDAQGELRPAASLPFAQRAQALVHTAPSALGARILLDQSAGAMGKALDSIRGLEARERGAKLLRLAARGRARLRLFRESTVALVGPVNAGKSTLFNLLVGTGAASVSSEAGTTRDALLERGRIGPWPVRWLDTAGERELAHRVADGDRSAQVEQAGQEIARSLAQRADVVLRLEPVERSSGASAAAPGEVRLGTQAARVLGAEPGAVSYTHLTLPTICSV